jgi:hypothetical protein
MPNRIKEEAAEMAASSFIFNFGNIGLWFVLPIDS